MQQRPDTTDIASNFSGTGFLEKILSAGPGIILLINADGNILYHSKQFHSLFDQPVEVDDSTSLFNFLGAAQRDRLLRQLEDAQKAGGTQKSYHIYTLKGSSVAVCIYASMFDVGEGSAAYFYLYLLPDVSRKKLPFLSSDSREIFLEQFGTLAFGTFEWVVGSDTIFWSDGVYEIYEMGKPANELNYEYVRKFTHPEDSKRTKVEIQRTLEQGGEFNIESRIITPTQKIKVINSTGKALFDEGGKAVKLIGSVRDITAQRQIEQELEKNISELNRSNKELEEFAYVASHDLQEPLRKITTFCDRLAEKYSSLLTGDGSMYMSRIVASAENMRTLINNLLEFSRVTRDKQPFERVNLDFVLHQVKTDLELIIEETGTSIEANKLTTVHGSLTQLKQLFTNIISNAIKFRKTGEKCIVTIASEALPEDQKLVYSLPLSGRFEKITIRDNGIGFDNVYAERIFQIFQRLNGKAEYPGSGIGLAICKKIVEHHNGLIFAEGTEGNGASFIIILPAADSQ